MIILRSLDPMRQVSLNRLCCVIFWCHVIIVSHLMRLNAMHLNQTKNSCRKSRRKSRTWPLFGASEKDSALR
jgi:hypothetical protein